MASARIILQLLKVSIILNACSSTFGQVDNRHSKVSHASKHHFRSEMAHSQFETVDRINKTKHELATKSRIGIFILSTSKNGGIFYRVNAIGSHETWARSFPNVFYIMADNPAARFSFRHCKLKWIYADEIDSDIVTNYTQTTKKAKHSSLRSNEELDFDEPDPFLKKFLTAKCHNEPNVILTSACDDSYYGSRGPCCKLDVAVTFALSKSVSYSIYTIYKHLFQTEYIYIDFFRKKK